MLQCAGSGAECGAECGCCSVLNVAAAGLWTEPFGGAPCVVSLTERQTCIIGRQAADKTKGSSTKVAVCHEYHDADMKRGGKSVTTPDGRPVLMWGTVSSNHLTVRMLPDGMVELIDHSTHGTFIGVGEHERRLAKEVGDKLSCEDSPFRLQLGKDSDHAYQLTIEAPVGK